MEVSVHIEDAEVMEDLRREMELPEGILVTNLFIPVAVACLVVHLGPASPAGVCFTQIVV